MWKIGLVDSINDVGYALVSFQQDSATGVTASRVSGTDMSITTSCLQAVEFLDGTTVYPFDVTLSTAQTSISTAHSSVEYGRTLAHYAGLYGRMGKFAQATSLNWGAVQLGPTPQDATSLTTNRFATQSIATTARAQLVQFGGVSP